MDETSSDQKHYRYVQRDRKRCADGQDTWDWQNDRVPVAQTRQNILWRVYLQVDTQNIYQASPHSLQTHQYTAFRYCAAVSREACGSQEDQAHFASISWGNDDTPVSQKTRSDCKANQLQKATFSKW